ncbi:Gfo/Idh/MocA family protein [Sorangium cellulosum]|nr:Gfo/Idh/MocA family oxidoreductase [Sorangium cellulosum]
MIGMGVISKFYVAGFPRVDGAKLVAVCDLRKERVAPFEARGLDTTLDYRELLAREDIDAVIINVPNDEHYAICRDALAAGKHVCCEKPLTIRRADAERLVGQARAAGRTLFTAFHRRYNANVVRALPQLADRSRIASVTARYLEKIEEHAGDDRWYLDSRRCGGGCLADNGPNVFDTLASFLGRMEVTRAAVERDGGGIDREADVDLVSEGGIPVHVRLDWAYPRGERKDIEVSLKSGERVVIDMLAGFDEFKGSLWHEYEEIVRDFVATIGAGGCHGEDGLDAVRLVDDAYAAEGLSRTAQARKRAVPTTVVKLLQHKRSDRGFVLERHATRCVRAGEVHELVTTDQATAGPGDRVDRVGFLGFVEARAAGVIERGDLVVHGGTVIGRVLGFDACHFPNHYNVLVAAAAPVTAGELGLAVEDTVKFLPGEPSPEGEGR